MTESIATKGRHQPGRNRFRSISNEDVAGTSFPAFPAAARLAILVGNPQGAGICGIPVHLPTGTKMMPHTHPEHRVSTVVSGVFYNGLGDVFDEGKLVAHAPGSVVVLPGGQPHFHWAKSGDYVTQVSAVGPLGLDYVDRADPRESVQATSS